MPASPTPPLRANTRLSKALELHPDVLAYIVTLAPHDFERLLNPVMRRLMPPRISLGRVAAIAGMPVNDLLERLSAITGAPFASSEDLPMPQSTHEPPVWLSRINPASMPTVNLLPLDDALDADPMPPVMLEVKKLQPGEVLLILHRWEPQPFYDVWAQMPGLEWYSQQVRDDEWHIFVRRT